MIFMKILIAEDNIFIRVAIKKVLQKNYPEVELEETINGPDLLVKALKKDSHWDLIIANIESADLAGIEVTENLQKIQHPHILITSAVEKDSYAKFSFLNNISGYVLNNHIHDELPKAVSTIMHGNQYFSGNVKLMDAYQLNEQLSIAS